MSNLAYLLFNDKELPGYPDSTRTIADLLKDGDGNTLVKIGPISSRINITPAITPIPIKYNMILRTSMLAGFS